MNNEKMKENLEENFETKFSIEPMLKDIKDMENTASDLLDRISMLKDFINGNKENIHRFIKEKFNPTGIDFLNVPVIVIDEIEKVWESLIENGGKKYKALKPYHDMGGIICPIFHDRVCAKSSVKKLTRNRKEIKEITEDFIKIKGIKTEKITVNGKTRSCYLFR